MKLIRRLQHPGSPVADIAAAVVALALLIAAGAELSWTARGLPLVALLFLGRRPEASHGPERHWARPVRWLPVLAVVGGTALIWWWFFAVPGATALQWVVLFGVLRVLPPAFQWLRRHRPNAAPRTRRGLPRWLARAAAWTDAPPSAASGLQPPAWRFRLILIALIGLVTLVHFRLAHVPGAPWLNRDPVGFYPLQTAGFLAGQLHAAIEPHPELLALADPYDPVANAPYRVHDMTLWQGRYYLYFGIAPILLLVLPFRLLTGWYLSEPATVAIFTSVGFALAALVVVEWRRRSFPRASRGLTLLLLAALAFASPTLLLNQLAQFYQVPIACAYALGMAAAWAALRTVTRPDRAYRWLGVAGGLLALCLAARPNYLLATVALLLLVQHVLRDETGGPRPIRILNTLAIAFGPVALVGGALLGYNWLRFGNPLEFGMRYQLAGESFVNFTPLHPRHLLPHAFEYLWAPGWWRPYFPFFETRPEAPFGVLRFLPLAGLGVVGGLLACPASSGPKPTRTLVRFLLAIAAANLLMLSLFFYAPMLRYLADFAPALLLLGVLTSVAVLHHLAGSNLVRLGVALLALATTLPTLATLAQRSSVAPAPWTRVFNYPTHWVQQLLGRAHGPLQLVVRVPPVAPAEPIVLLHTGRTSDRYDQLRLYILAPDTVQLAHFHAGLGELRGAELPVPPDRRLELVVHSGALLPPPSHPVFRNWSPEAIAAAHRRLEIRVGSQTVLAAALQPYPSRAGEWLQPAHEAVERLEQLPLQPVELVSTLHQNFDGPRRLRLQLPAVPAGQEPLIATGAGQRSDLLYLSYGPGPTVRFGFDHFGGAGRLSGPFSYDPVAEHVLDYWLEPDGEPAGSDSAADGAMRRRLLLRFNGQTVFDELVEVHPRGPHPTVLGANRHGAGSAGAAFTGRILAVEAAPPASPSR